MKSKANVNVYLLLFKNNELLLSLRQNTGYEDNKWSLVAGHQESGESATQAMIREAREEIGVEIEIEDLSVAHVMHRNTDRENIDVFFRCENWKRECTNQEPEKCGGLNFYPLDQLPENIIPYIKDAIARIRSNISYSELGWTKGSQARQRLDSSIVS